MFLVNKLMSRQSKQVIFIPRLLVNLFTYLNISLNLSIT